MDKSWWQHHKETREDKLKDLSDDERIYKSVEKHEKSGMTIIRAHLIEKELNEFDKMSLNNEKSIVGKGMVETVKSKTEKVRTEITKELKVMKEPGKATIGLFSKYDTVAKKAKKIIEKNKKE